MTLRSRRQIDGVGGRGEGGWAKVASTADDAQVLDGQDAETHAFEADLVADGGLVADAVEDQPGDRVEGPG